MRNFTTVASILATGMLLGNAQAQDTPPAKTETAPAAKTQTAPAAKTPKAPSAKTAPAKTTAATKGAAVTTLTTQKQKFSYALGMNLGASLHNNPSMSIPASWRRVCEQLWQAAKLC
jgi:hypothetical protein